MCPPRFPVEPRCDKAVGALVYSRLQIGYLRMHKQRGNVVCGSPDPVFCRNSVVRGSPDPALGQKNGEFSNQSDEHAKASQIGTQGAEERRNSKTNWQWCQQARRRSSQTCRAWHPGQHANGLYRQSADGCPAYCSEDWPPARNKQRQCVADGHQVARAVHSLGAGRGRRRRREKHPDGDAGLGGRPVFERGALRSTASEGRRTLRYCNPSAAATSGDGLSPSFRACSTW
jgi:hypothetical protein